MDDLIIGCSTNYDWNKLKYWINSVNKCGFVGKKILILMNCDAETVNKVVQSGFDVVAFNKDEKGNLLYNSSLAVHVERFLHIYRILSMNQYRYVITTDVKDVVFQKNPVEFLEKNLPVNGDKKYVFSSESIRYRDEPWGNNNLLETFGPFFHEMFRNNLIYNVGVLAGHGDAIRDLSAMIFNMSINRAIPIVDQAVFNFMVSQQPYLSTSLYLPSESGWACQLGTTVDPSKIESFKYFLLEQSPVFDGEKVMTSTGSEYYIVHQYDRVPDWKKIIEEKYGE